jgi:NADH-quinone oxidoreductase subunit F
MVDMAKLLLNFAQLESCGKCTPCREGAKRMFETLEKICNGMGEMQDIDTLELLCRVIKRTALCPLGQTAPDPVETTLRLFRGEYEAHILERRCPAGVCTALVKYGILADKCTGCGDCVEACQAGAIKGKENEPHSIDAAICTKCGHCIPKCEFGAIVMA